MPYHSLNGINTGREEQVITVNDNKVFNFICYFRDCTCDWHPQFADNTEIIGNLPISFCVELCYVKVGVDLELECLLESLTFPVKASSFYACNFLFIQNTVPLSVTSVIIFTWKQKFRPDLGFRK